MTGKRMGAGRRLPALALDAACVVFLFAVVLRVTVPADVFVLLGGADHLSGLTGEWQSLLDGELAPDSGERIELELQGRWSDLPRNLNPAMFFADSELRVRMYQDFVKALRAEVSPEVYPEFDALAERTARELAGLSIPQVADSLVGFLAGVLLLPLLVVLVYWGSELLFGWSFGKRLLHLRISSLDGTSGNPGLYFSRFLFKQSSLLLSVAGLAAGVWWLVIAAAAALMGTVLGSLRMLGGDKRALHDVLSGTAVVYRSRPSGRSA